MRVTVVRIHADPLMPSTIKVEAIEYQNARHFGRHMAETFAKSPSRIVYQVCEPDDPDGTRVILALCGNGPKAQYYAERIARLLSEAQDA